MRGISIFALVLVTLFASVNSLQAQKIDILLKGGHVIDAKNKIDSKMDVAIADGKILHVSQNISVKDVTYSIIFSFLTNLPGYTK